VSADHERTTGCAGARTEVHVDQIHAKEYEELAVERARRSGVDVDLDVLAVTFNLVRAANKLVADLEQNVYRARGISYAGFRVLFALWVAGEKEPRQLAQLAAVTRSSVSSVLNTLEDAGLVERRRESTDRRVVTVDLTRRGLEMVLDTFSSHHEREREWTDGLSAHERHTLADLLRRVVEHHAN
jgi:DNA-binding MarR family transcriptional regulator